MDLDLTSVQLFEPLTEVNYGKDHVDLHNDYFCTEITQILTNEYLKLIFESSDIDAVKHRVVIEFSDVDIVKMSLPLQTGKKVKLTLDVFYRGRYESDGELLEVSEKGKRYFYVGFDEEYQIELFASAVGAVL